MRKFKQATDPKVGDIVLDKNGKEFVVFGGRDNIGCIIAKANLMYYSFHYSDLFIKPLCYLRGEPVYAGDTLWVNILCSRIGWETHTADYIATIDGTIQVWENSSDSYVLLDELFFEAPKVKVKKSAWINVYKHLNFIGYATKKEADEHANADRIDCVEIHWKE